MGSPFTTTSVSSYNSNPPSDDGAQTSTNRVQWSTQKSKLTDPIKTAFDTSETNTANAFAKIPGGASGVTTTSANYTVASGDQGKIVEATSSGIVLTTPDATSVGAPFLFRVLNTTAGDITLTGNNPGTQQNVDGVTSITIPAGCGLSCDTDGTNWYTSGQNFSKTQVSPQGRLTLVSGTPVMSADETAKTAVYYTPYVGDLIPIPNGTTFSVKEFSELTLTLNSTNYLAGIIYDVFVALNPADNSTVIIGTGPAWSTSTAGSGARGSGAGTTEISRLKGLFVNNNAITLRNNTTTYSIATKSATFVGSILIDGTNGQVSCHVSAGQSRKWSLSNAYNRRSVVLIGVDTTASWSYTSGTVRSSNGSSANSMTTIDCLGEEYIVCKFNQRAYGQNTSSFAIGLGYNSTTAFSGFVGQYGNAGGSTTQVGDMLVSALTVQPTLGAIVINALEQGNTSATFYGTAASFNFTSEWMA